MKKRIDFVLNENSFRRDIFRFYPRSSHCHSFTDEPPVCWEGVYKVYYSYAVIRQWLDNGEVEETEVLWSCDFDECSAIDRVGYICEKICEGIFSEPIGDRMWNYLNEAINPFGDGVSWVIRKDKRYEHWDEDGNFLDEPKEYDDFQFLASKGNGVSMTFVLSEEKTKEFGKYLKYCCDYMLKHGEGI